MTNLKIGLCGTGNVGSAFIEPVLTKIKMNKKINYYIL